MQTLDFLAAILPEDCYYFVATPAATGKGFAHVACSSIDELAHRISRLEAGNTEIYYAVAGYREEYVDRPVHTGEGDGIKIRRQYRIKENVKLVKSYWLDLDVGVAEPGKAAKYPDQRAALLALNDFLIKTGLPKPMIISSGYGIHVYWPLAHSVLPGQWRATALQLKELTVGLQMLTDTTRTADEASVLRPVGTSNRKIKNGVAGAEPVRCLLPVEGQPVLYTENSAFHTAVLSALKANNIKAPEDKTGDLKANPSDMIVPVGGFQKVSALKVADKCNQIKLFRETGGVSEPHWYRSLQIMPHTVEGEPLAHEWSKVHKEYTPEQTEMKLAQVRTMGPTLCSTFNTANPDGCKQCPFAGKISTPLQLGMIIEEAPAPTVKEIVDGEEREVTLPNPPYPFKRGSGEQAGLFMEIDQGVPVRFYPYDLYPYEIVNDEGKQEGSVNVRHWLPREGWRDFNTRLELIESPREFLGRMRNNFVNPENGKQMVLYMDAYLKQLQDQTKIKRLHTKLGWLQNEHSFLLGHKLYTPTGTHPAGISTTVSSKIINSYRVKGEHEAWQRAIRMYDKPGLEAHLFSVLIGFGAPLFKLTGLGGIVASMLGRSGAGKTLAGRAMASIYGDFSPFKAGANDTFNARIERLGMLSNMPVYIDEHTDIKPEDVGKLMYQVSSGEGRTRLRSDASVKEAAEWSTIVLTSGNGSMVGRLMELKVDPQAELMRLFEYPVTEVKWFEQEMPRLYDMLEGNFGHAGEKYIHYLVRLAESDTSAELTKLVTTFSQHVGFEGKERFWYALIACVLYGLWVAEAAGAMKFEDTNATYHRLWAWCSDQVKRQRGVVVENQLSGVEALSMFLNAHLADRLVIIENKTGLGETIVLKHPAAHGKLLIQYNPATGQLFIDQGSIRNWFNKNQLNSHAIKQELLAAKILVDHGEQDYKVTLGKGTQYKGGQTRVWEINAKHPLLGGLENTLFKDSEVKA